MEVEDDVLFAELSRQLALLIMDDDEQFPVQPPPPLPFPGFHQVSQAVMMPSSLTYEASFMRESKGTGVFIPQCKYPRRKNRSGRPNSSNNSYKETNKPGTLVAHANTECCIENFNHCHSSVLKKEKFTN
ncbi:hypothetical protein IHE45_07G056100 [Dioscorea alata]|uniref:Uncharacterized protein n=1 Tax=Dioscorea alata TaxID=55571 RepID=A0ACB7VRM8_DIOAL|nr:hypothetical protein IHE45_07G056100 [Dioscorea alata]